MLSENLGSPAEVGQARAKSVIAMKIRSKVIALYYNFD